MNSEYRTHTRFLLVMVLIPSVSAGCGSVTAPELDYPCVSWCNTVAPWPHDGNPFESQHFTIYSDGASLQARMDLAAIGEEVLTDLKSRFEIPSNDLFILPADQTKIHLYAYKYHFPTQWGGQGFWGGMIIFSLDHPERTEAGHTEHGNYTRLVTHEIMHVMQGLLVGSNHCYSTHTWFE